MKLSFKNTIAEKRSEDGAPATAGFGPWTLDFGPGERGVALVITLIMLSIITFMAITFLVLSQRERSSATTATDQKIAHMAVDTGNTRAIADLVTHALVLTNWQDMPFLVSTTFVNYPGFNNGLTTPYATNVDYDWEATPTGPRPYSGGAIELQRNIANLLLNPRVPVYIVTNTGTGEGEFRFYLDLNRNGRFDTNGTWAVLSGNPNAPYINATNNQQVPAGFGPLLSNNFTGDPEWIGIFERPQEFHSADNRAVARYAYMVIPIENTLDINHIHNQAKRLNTPNGSSSEGFLRNQGVGTWELNLASFLADLNTNIWWLSNGTPEYVYTNNTLYPSTGGAFDDANTLLQYRYGPRGYLGLNTASQLFPGSGGTFTSDNIDYYSDGPVMLGTSANENAPSDNPFFAWSGSDNTNHFFTTQDPFDPAKTGNFGANLMTLSSSNDSYNAYTYYRMLAQLGSDSVPEQNKINLNYKNTDNSGNIVPGMETNLTPWAPAEFFTNAAHAMFKQMNLRDFNGNLITVTNIPLYPTNYYTPAVHRMLQLAANIYDATTNRALAPGQTNAFFPSVFRPIFMSQNGQVWISGYAEVADTTPLLYQYWDLATASNNPGPLAGINIYGVPWVIGAKTGFPNFNEFSMENAAMVARDLMFTNYDNQAWTGKTNQSFGFALTNSFGMEAWNSYTNPFTRPLALYASNEFSVVLSNEFGFPFLIATNQQFGTNMTINFWPGWNPLNQTGNSLKVLYQNTINLTNGVLIPGSGGNPPVFRPFPPPIWTAAQHPHVYMGLSLRVQYYLVDTSVTPNRVVDYVNLDSEPAPIDVIYQASAGGNPNIYPNDGSKGGQWLTNTFPLASPSGVEQGIQDQIDAGLAYPIDMNDWQNLPQGTTKLQAIACFRYHLRGQGSASAQCAPSTAFQDPYSPHRVIHQSISWQANDPFIHYMATDLTNTTALAPYNGVRDDASKNDGLPNLGKVNVSFQPWGGNRWNQSQGDTTLYDFRLKDPLMTKSDDWDFPTNRFPNVGWLGRVHRGSSWQTVYLKAGPIDLKTWTTWTGDSMTNGGVFDAALSEPTQDYGLFDVFTTAVNENATRGQLNINQTNLAAWSAALSGVNVLGNTPAGPVPSTISPAGVYDPSNNPTPLFQIWQGINNTRAGTNPATGVLFPNGVFQHKGDILATPQLTIASPFINTNALTSATAGGINDEILERIPQQVMSLLTLNQTPRFVIYSYGQTLHPADHSLVTGGTFNGLCTNYQVTAEIATRAVVRVDGSPDPQYVNGRVDAQGRSYPPHVVVEQFNVLPPD